MNLNSPERDTRWIIAPASYQSFLKAHWGEVPLRVARNSPGYYDDLFSEAKLEQALYLASKIPGALEQLTDNETPRRCRDFSSAIEAFRQGKSLRIDSVQRFSRELALLCRAIEQDLSCPINVNMYLSPGATRALSRHFDTHDVFVLQTHGRKRWRLYDSPVRFPLESLPLIRGETPKSMRTHRLDYRKQIAEEKDSCVLKEEFVLMSGDFLYLPRGHWHEAEAEPGHTSCHLTIGAQTFTYTDLLTVAISRAAIHDDRLRRALPPGFATHANSRRIVEEQIAEITQILASAANRNVEGALEELGEIFSRNRRAPIADGILHIFDRRNACNIKLNSEVRMRDGLICRVSQSLTEVALAFENTRVMLPLAFEPACRFITSHRRFTPAEIPGEISDAERVSLSQRLVSDGLLIRAIRESRPPTGSPGIWLPVKLAFTPKGASIRWLQIGQQTLDEPFFHQSVARLMAADPQPQIRISGVKSLQRIAPHVPPAGFIFHISRCGSTLVSNALKAFPGIIIISEPQPVAELLMHPEFKDDASGSWEQTRDKILKGVVTAYGQRQRKNDNALVIKFQSWNILFLDIIQRLWPEVPCLVVIRNPIEVIVSCLRQPPGWMAWQQEPARASRIFSWSAESILGMSREEFCARALGRFLDVARRSTSPLRAVDYEDLRPAKMEEIGKLFGFDVEHVDSEKLNREMGIYSKDKTRNQSFQDDRGWKQQQATELIRNESRRWANDAYNALQESHSL